MPAGSLAWSSSAYIALAATARVRGSPGSAIWPAHRMQPLPRTFASTRSQLWSPQVGQVQQMRRLDPRVTSLGRRVWWRVHHWVARSGRSVARSLTPDVAPLRGRHTPQPEPSRARDLPVAAHRCRVPSGVRWTQCIFLSVPGVTSQGDGPGVEQSHSRTSCGYRSASEPSTRCPWGQEVWSQPASTDPVVAGTSWSLSAASSRSGR